jgi:hypothetical protein
MCHGSTARIITKIVRIMEATACIVVEESATMFPSSYSAARSLVSEIHRRHSKSQKIN